MSRNTSIPSTTESKGSVKELENGERQPSVATGENRRVQIGNCPTRPPGPTPPRILNLRVAADGPRLESVEVEIIDWDGPNDPENPYVSCSDLEDWIR